MPQKKVSFNVSPYISFLTNLNAVFSEEQFLLNIFSGNQVHRFALSPQHAKRMLMLLEKKIKAYEDKYGEIKTKLPERKQVGTKEEGTKLGFEAK